MKNASVSITGMGMVSSLGNSVSACWDKLVSGESGIKPIMRFEIEGLANTHAGFVDLPQAENLEAVEKALSLLGTVIDEAISQSALTPEEVKKSAMVIALCPFDMNWQQRIAILEDVESPEDVFEPLVGCERSIDLMQNTLISELVENVRRAYELQSVPIALHTACSSGNSAIQIGRELLMDGMADRVIVAGCEVSTSSDSFLRFGLLKTLDSVSESRSTIPRPFSADRGGFVLAEGAAAMVLQSEANPSQTHLATILGCGEAVDVFHRTRSDPEAAAAIDAIQRALSDASLDPQEIDYINAHGTGTFENDKTEARAILQIFGERGKKIPVSSNKSMVGHTLSAAGVIEAVFTVMSIRMRKCPPTINYETPDPAIPLNVVPNMALDCDISFALSNSFGFGGQNVCVVFGR